MNKYVLIYFLLMGFTSCGGQIKQSSPDSQRDESTIIADGDKDNDLYKNIGAIYQDKDFNYWFGSDGKGVYYYDGEVVKNFTEKDGLCSKTILGIQEDADGLIYFDTPDGICRYDGGSFETLMIEEFDSVNSRWQLTPDDLWFRMGWNNNGPLRFDGKKLYPLKFPRNKMEKEFYAINPNASFNPYGVYSIYKDSKGHMWFGTSSLGLYKYDGEQISWMYEDRLTNTPQGGSFGIRSIIEDEDGYMWICNPTYKYKIGQSKPKNTQLEPLIYQREKGIEIEGVENIYFQSMILDSDGNMWMLTYTDGIYRYDGTELERYLIEKDKESLHLYSLYSDRRGDIWVVTLDDGPYKWNGEKFEKFVIK